MYEFGNILGNKRAAPSCTELNAKTVETVYNAFPQYLSRPCRRGVGGAAPTLNMPARLSVSLAVANGRLILQACCPSELLRLSSTAIDERFLKLNLLERNTGA